MSRNMIFLFNIDEKTFVICRDIVVTVFAVAQRITGARNIIFDLYSQERQTITILPAIGGIAFFCFVFGRRLCIKLNSFPD